MHCQECFPEMGLLIYLEWNIESMMGRNPLAASHNFCELPIPRQDFWPSSTHSDIMRCFH